MHNVDKDNAYATLRSLAIENNQRLAPTAQNVVAMLEKN